MTRRDFLSILAAGAFLLGHRAVFPQLPSRIRRVGIIDDGPLWVYFREHLRELGDIEGQNITIEPQTGNGHPDQLIAAAQELARRPMDVIAVAGSSAAKSAQAATDTVPIVAMVIGDPVAIGLVEDW